MSDETKDSLKQLTARIRSVQKSETKLFNSGTMIVPNYAEGSPFYSPVEELLEDQSEGVIKMKLEKSKILETEERLNNLVKELAIMVSSAHLTNTIDNN